MMTTLGQLDFVPSMWSAPFTDGHLWMGMVTSILVGATCGVLGCFVVLRRMALIGDALSHAVLPGVVIAFLVTQNTGIVGLLFGALLAGLTTAVLINLVSHNSRTKEDSAIGIVFTALFALGLVLISNLPRGTHFDLKCFVFGIPEAVGMPDLWLMAVIAAIVLITVVLFYHPMKLISFDPVVAAAMGLPVMAFHYLLMGMISATVVAGLKTTGVVLVVAMVITPASAAYQLCNRFSTMLLLGGIFGALSAALGMIGAYVVNAPSGPSMVLVATTIFALAMLGSPRHGVVFRSIRRWRHRRHIETEDVLKTIHHLDRSDQPTDVAAISSQSRVTMARAKAILRELRQHKLIEGGASTLNLTEAGQRRALEMVRSHRLWESYLADQANMPPDQVHDVAEKLEHAHELADEVDRELGHPSLDPHGEEIPRG
ncbi:iron chelate uptake ABC transporter family permease subunit [Planctomycetales bacterium ZRK34]|nr:iron chelate uptake ABC transporter family permease subunit [Planctomycetales bacterium ZRK34]